LREICDDIVADNLRAADVVGRLSALFRRGEMNPAPLNLNQLVTETLDLVHTELLTRHVSAATELAPGLPTVLGSRVHLQQVLLNLILNGANAMTRVAAAERELVIRTEVEGEEVSVSVIDKGSGIAPEDVGNVFEPLGTPKDTGNDVGLVICRSILEAHHGTLTASINADGGATFRARWPLRRPS
jgi:C4-dicarboxylate-specific signal transduction histidine kinase